MQKFVISRAERECFERISKTVCTAGIYSIYKSVVNIRIGENIYSLVTQDTEDAPDCLTIAGISDFRELTGLDERIELDLSKADIYTLPKVKMSGADINPDVTMKQMERKLMGGKNSSPLVCAYYQMYDTGWRPDKKDDPLVDFFCDIFGKMQAAQVPAQDSNNQICIWWKAAVQMSGLGIGLTPSGDDFLAGAGLVMHYMLENRLESQELQRKLEQRYLEKNTTRLAQQIVLNSLHGRARVSELNLLKAIIENDQQQCMKMADKVMAFGSTSGSETLLGMLYMLMGKQEGIL